MKLMKSNVFDNLTDAKAYINSMGGPANYEIMAWTNKNQQKQYTVLLKRRAGRKSGR